MEFDSERQAGNAAVVRALQRRTAGRDRPWTFSPIAPKPPDLRPWEGKDPAVRARWEEDLRWITNRPNWVKVTVNAKGLEDVAQKPVTASQAQAQVAPPAVQPEGRPERSVPGPVRAGGGGPHQAGRTLFLQGGVGGTEGSGPRNAPNCTGDASVQGGIGYQRP
jgi:hypothetical protein